MKLMTKEIASKLEAAAVKGTDGMSPIPVVVKFFDPCGSWTWYAVEGEKVGPGENDWLLFGLVEGFESELGYFSVAELAEVKGPLGLGIERDLNFSGMAIDTESFPAKVVKGGA